MNDTNALEGDTSASFKIELSKKLTSNHKVRCYFKDEQIDLSSNKYAIEIKDFHCILHVKNIELGDEGSYSIQVDKAKSTADLVVEGIQIKLNLIE